MRNECTPNKLEFALVEDRVWTIDLDGVDMYNYSQYVHYLLCVWLGVVVVGICIWKEENMNSRENS